MYFATASCSLVKHYPLPNAGLLTQLAFEVIEEGHNANVGAWL